jgi:hypothetical protein
MRHDGALQDQKQSSRLFRVQQFQKSRRRLDVLSEGAAALGGFGILAPGLDLKALVELGGGEGRLGIDPSFE